MLALTDESPIPLRERLHALAEFLPHFESPGFEFGHWECPVSEEPDVIVMPYFVLGSVALTFYKMAYDMDWVRDDNWGSWMGTPEAASLRDDPAALARATPEQLAKLLTVLIRQDRFCEGALESAFETGLLTSITRRASALDAEMTRE